MEVCSGVMMCFLSAVVPVCVCVCVCVCAVVMCFLSAVVCVCVCEHGRNRISMTCCLLMYPSLCGQQEQAVRKTTHISISTHGFPVPAPLRGDTLTDRQGNAQVTHQSGGDRCTSEHLSMRNQTRLRISFE